MPTQSFVNRRSFLGVGSAGLLGLGLPDLLRADALRGETKKKATGTILVGTDAPSIDPADAEDLPAHRALLSRGVALLEDLALEAIEEGTYQLVALPLRLDALDASPVRAILIRD